MKKLSMFLMSLSASALFAAEAGELYNPDMPEKSCMKFNWVEKVAINYAEAKADIYKKLDILDKIGGGGRVETAKQWLDGERPKVVKFLEEEYFGKMPPRPEKLEFKLVESSEDAIGGIAKRRQYKIISTDKNGTHIFNVLIYYPKSASRENPVPAFIYTNYNGNHTTVSEPEVLLPEEGTWLSNSKRGKITDNRAHDYQRGTGAPRNPFKDIVSRGYAVATFCYCEIYPDKEHILSENESVFRIFDKSAVDKDPRCIAAWAWGDCRVLDLLETLPFIDRSKIGVAGHSRLGKTALLAGAYDTRFALAVSNSSCCGGASMNRRNYGENLKFAATYFPCWYKPKMKEYAENIESMPIDAQHMLAAMAPRMVYVLSGTEDIWADPKGEFMSLAEAGKIYALFGAKKMATLDDLRVKKPFVGDGFGYVLYDGPHQIDAYNWKCIMDFTDAHGWTKRK